MMDTLIVVCIWIARGGSVRSSRSNASTFRMDAGASSSNVSMLKRTTTTSSIMSIIQKQQEQQSQESSRGLLIRSVESGGDARDRRNRTEMEDESRDEDEKDKESCEESTSRGGSSLTEEERSSLSFPLDILVDVLDNGWDGTTYAERGGEEAVEWCTLTDPVQVWSRVRSILLARDETPPPSIDVEDSSLRKTRKISHVDLVQSLDLIFRVLEAALVDGKFVKRTHFHLDFLFYILFIVIYYYHYDFFFLWVGGGGD